MLAFVTPFLDGGTLGLRRHGGDIGPGSQGAVCRWRCPENRRQLGWRGATCCGDSLHLTAWRLQRRGHRKFVYLAHPNGESKHHQERQHECRIRCL
jgi:hypothetical protein